MYLGCVKKRDPFTNHCLKFCPFLGQQEETKKRHEACSRTQTAIIDNRNISTHGRIYNNRWCINLDTRTALIFPARVGVWLYSVIMCLPECTDKIYVYASLLVQLYDNKATILLLLLLLASLDIQNHAMIRVICYYYGCCDAPGGGGGTQGKGLAWTYPWPPC